MGSLTVRSPAAKTQISSSATRPFKSLVTPPMVSGPAFSRNSTPLPLSASTFATSSPRSMPVWAINSAVAAARSVARLPWIEPVRASSRAAPLVDKVLVKLMLPAVTSMSPFMTSVGFVWNRTVSAASPTIVKSASNTVPSPWTSSASVPPPGLTVSDPDGFANSNVSAVPLVVRSCDRPSAGVGFEEPSRLSSRIAASFAADSVSVRFSLPLDMMTGSNPVYVIRASRVASPSWSRSILPS